ncbi:hypothetical protein [Pseudobacteriovorax antillogorgiicola]|uniref:hypothetical protein n=1 Tax=Pseudobacteriovorax antillogorgiicola TaxID=1513793 RepID=UPI00104AF18D|nr:hypothetical protein [Pseudobacteriovorax antillogorgiicola]
MTRSVRGFAVTRDKSKRRSLYDYEQPFDLFEEFEKGAGAERLRAPQKVRTRPNLKIYLLALSFIGTVITGFGFLGFVNKPSPKKPFVLVEVRAISESGNPIAGADVFLEDKKFGVTDSFGEWRRYLRFRVGKQLDIRIRKQMENGIIQAYKQVQVPVPKGPEDETEFKMTLELKSENQQAAAMQTGPKERAIQEPSRISQADNEAINEPREQIQILGDQARKSMEYTDTKRLSSIDIRLTPFKSRYGTLMEAHQSRVLGVKVVPEMIALAAEEGLRIQKNASWKYDIQYVAHQGQVGFIKGTLRWLDGNQTRERSFLQNFSKTILETADNLLRLAKLHVNRPYLAYQHGKEWHIAQEGLIKYWKVRHGLQLMNRDRQIFTIKRRGITALLGAGKPCPSGKSSCLLWTPSTRERPPHGGWALQRLRFQGGFPKGGEVYINGFQAFPGQSGDFEFWGKPGVTHRLTLLTGNSIYFRTRVVPSSEQGLEVKLPTRIARR